MMWTSSWTLLPFQSSWRFSRLRQRTSVTLLGELCQILTVLLFTAQDGHSDRLRSYVPRLHSLDRRSDYKYPGQHFKCFASDGEMVFQLIVKPGGSSFGYQFLLDHVTSMDLDFGRMAMYDMKYYKRCLLGIKGSF